MVEYSNPNKKREDFVKYNPLHDYPLEKKFSTFWPIKIMELPDGFELVKLRGGKNIRPKR